MNLIIEDLADQTPQLTNKGHLSLFFTGVGSSFSKNLFQTSAIIIKGEEHIMIDCGTLSPLVMDHLGLPIFHIKNLIITHSHADHAGGLEEAALLHRYLNHTRPNIIICENFSHLLWEESLKGGLQYNEFNGKDFLSFEDVFNPVTPKKIRVFDRDGWEYQQGNLNIKLFRTMHIPDSAKSWKTAAWSTGLIIDDSILYTGDTRFDPALFDNSYFKQNITTIFHDCQFMPPGGVHASFDELKTLPAEIKSKMYLMHYSDNWKAHELSVEKAGFAGFTRRWSYYHFK